MASQRTRQQQQQQQQQQRRDLSVAADSTAVGPTLYVNRITDRDVLLGRGTGPNHHIGNKRFKALRLILSRSSSL